MNTGLLRKHQGSQGVKEMGSAGKSLFPIVPMKGNRNDDVGNLRIGCWNDNCSLLLTFMDITGGLFPDCGVRVGGQRPKI